MTTTYPILTKKEADHYTPTTTPEIRVWVHPVHQTLRTLVYTYATLLIDNTWDQARCDVWLEDRIREAANDVDYGTVEMVRVSLLKNGRLGSSDLTSLHQSTKELPEGYLRVSDAFRRLWVMMLMHEADLKYRKALADYLNGEYLRSLEVLSYNLAPVNKRLPLGKLTPSHHKWKVTLDPADAEQECEEHDDF